MSEIQAPPAVAMGMLCFFAARPDFPAIIGDLKEEFHQRMLRSGVKEARRWFWHETFRNVWALAWGEVWRTPIRTTLMALACTFAIGACAAAYGFLVTSLEAIVYGPDPYPVLLMLSSGPPLVVGWLGGRLHAGRELALALMYLVLSIVGSAIGLAYLVYAGVDLNPILLLMLAPGLLRLGCFSLGCLATRCWFAGVSAGRL
jgi:hypothetical protein